MHHSKIRYTLVPFTKEFSRQNSAVNLYYKFLQQYSKISGCISDNKYTSMEFGLTTPFYDHWSVNLAKKYEYSDWFLIQTPPEKFTEIMYGVMKTNNFIVKDYEVFRLEGQDFLVAVCLAN